MPLPTMRTIYCRAFVSILVIVTIVVFRMMAAAPGVAETGYSHSAHVSSR